MVKVNVDDIVVKMVKVVKSGQKWSKVVKNGPKWSKVVNSG
jgi:DNA topoisomerase IB